MRIKNSAKEEKTFDVAGGLNFDTSFDDDSTTNEAVEPAEDIKAQKVSTLKKAPAKVDENTSGEYGRYYTPKPKLGSKGGKLGRRVLQESERKIQFSVTCTAEQKERFIEAAENDRRKLPEFVCLAIEEYIANHKL